MSPISMNMKEFFHYFLLLIIVKSIVKSMVQSQKIVIAFSIQRFTPHQMLRIKYVSRDSKKLGYFHFFFQNQATPGFELGNKGFAVLRLTTRPCRQKNTNLTFWGCIFELFFLVLAFLILYISHFLNSLPTNKKLLLF